MTEQADLDFQDLVRAATQGDGEARERFFSLALRIGLLAARKRLRPEDRALMESQDIRQSVLLRLYRRLPDLSFAEERDLAAWVAEATRRVLKEKRRHARRDKRDVARTMRYPTAGLPDPTAKSIRRATLRIAVEESLDELPDGTAEVVRLRSFEGRTFPDIAEALGLPGPDAARKRYARAMVLLSALLGETLDA